MKGFLKETSPLFSQTLHFKFPSVFFWGKKKNMKGFPDKGLWVYFWEHVSTVLKAP